MWSFRRFAPLRAFLDLRRYLASRGKHELIFMFAAFVVSVTLLSAFVVGSTPDKIYRPPTIIYVQSWPASRTDAEIVAQQKIDQAKKVVEDKKKAAEDAEIRRQYKRLSDQMNAIGI